MEEDDNDAHVEDSSVDVDDADTKDEVVVNNEFFDVEEDDEFFDVEEDDDEDLLLLSSSM
jgi:hypothetical protein